jgi:hypothetical protein
VGFDESLIVRVTLRDTGSRPELDLVKGNRLEYDFGSGIKAVVQRGCGPGVWIEIEITAPTLDELKKAYGRLMAELGLVKRETVVISSLRRSVNDNLAKIAASGELDAVKLHIAVGLLGGFLHQTGEAEIANALTALLES